MKFLRITLLTLSFVGFLAGSAPQASAQVSLKEQKTIIQERKKMSSWTREQVEKNSWKDAKKMAKQLKKEGWKPMPGSPTLETQMNDVLLHRYEMKGNFPRYILGMGEGVASTTGVARKQAVARARVELAGNIGVEVAELVENSESNIEYSAAEQESIGKMLASSQSMVQQSLGRTDVTFEAYREKNGSKEVLVYVTCDTKNVKSAILKAFNEEQKELRDKLENSLNQESAE